MYTLFILFYILLHPKHRQSLARYMCCFLLFNKLPVYMYAMTACCTKLLLKGHGARGFVIIVSKHGLFQHQLHLLNASLYVMPSLF
jgi:hypothetical protein